MTELEKELFALVDKLRAEKQKEDNNEWKKECEWRLATNQHINN